MSSSRRYLLAFVVFSSTFVHSSFASSTNATDNVVDVVADELLRECWSTASFSCVQNGLRRAIDTSLSSDMDVTDSVRFVSNGYKYSYEANRDYDEDDWEMNAVDVDDKDDHFNEFVKAVETSEAVEEGRSPEDGRQTTEEPHTHVSGIADILYNRGVRYLMTHDLNLDLPEYGFGGGRIRIQPKSFDDDGGVLIKLNFDEPKTATTSTTGEKGRFYLKRIRQIFKKKLMTSFMAAMLIIKLIKVKLMFLLPVIVGVTTAKKILLKVLLFLFPALTHLFKLCAYYHHHHTKLSHHFHHHHGVNHHVHHQPPIYVPPPSYEYDHPPPGATIIHRSEDNVLSQWGINYEEPSSENERIFTQPHTPVAAASVAYPTHQHSYAPSPTIHQPQHTPVFPENNEDPFYSPILDKLDRVFSELGFTDEPCKERLVCSMYKAPARFSPHSNLVSAEISRDPSELQKPVIQTPGVLRYFRYVAAARNGQDAKDCLSLYPHCSLLTE